MEKLKIAVCDDEARALSIVSSSVRGVFQDMGIDILLETFLGPMELLERVKVRTFDLIFMDISMPRIDGIKLGKTIHSLGSTANIVFVSNCTDRMFDAFSAEPFGFVRKDHFMRDINEVITRFAERTDCKDKDIVCFKDGHGAVSIDISQVKYIECVRNVQILYFENGNTHKTYSRMETLEQELDKFGFIRIHRGYLANCKYVVRFDIKSLVLTTGEEIPIGRSYHQKAKKDYLAYVGQSGMSFIGHGSAL